MRARLSHVMGPPGGIYATPVIRLVVAVRVRFRYDVRIEAGQILRWMRDVRVSFF